MVCIFCSSDLRVTNSRPQKRTNRIWRRRECTSCKSLFTSTEAIDLSGNIRVSHGKTLEPFFREKLTISLYESLKHRESAQQDAGALADTVSARLIATLPENGVISSRDIVAAVGEVLQRFDAVAAPHYAAFHKK